MQDGEKQDEAEVFVCKENGGLPDISETWWHNSHNQNTNIKENPFFQENTFWGEKEVVPCYRLRLYMLLPRSHALVASFPTTPPAKSPF